MSAHSTQGFNQQAFFFTEIWVVGDFLVRWAGTRFMETSTNILAGHIIDWDGHCGLTVEDVHSKLQLGLIRGKTPKNNISTFWRKQSGEH